MVSHSLFFRSSNQLIFSPAHPLVKSSFPSRTRAAHSQPTLTHSVVRLNLNYSGFNPSPGPGLAASERGRSNGSSVLTPFLLVHRSISIEFEIISPSLDLPTRFPRNEIEMEAGAESPSWKVFGARSRFGTHSYQSRAKAHAVFNPYPKGPEWNGAFRQPTKLLVWFG